MRKVCGFCLAVALGVALGRMSSGRIQEAEAGGGSNLQTCSAQNGDVNSDGKVDVSDAIAVLQFLFLGEPELLQPLCPTGLPSPLPTPGRYVDNGDGTVTDEATGLMWEKSEGPLSPNWQAAVDYCEGLNLAGQDDWRMPNILELAALLQFESGEALNSVFKSVDLSNEYWSTTSDIVNPIVLRYVADFGQQPLSKLSYKATNYAGARVRAVRKAQ